MPTKVPVAGSRWKILPRRHRHRSEQASIICLCLLLLGIEDAAGIRGGKVGQVLLARQPLYNDDTTSSLPARTFDKDSFHITTAPSNAQGRSTLPKNSIGTDLKKKTSTSNVRLGYDVPRDLNFTIITSSTSKRALLEEPTTQPAPNATENGTNSSLSTSSNTSASMSSSVDDDREALSEASNVTATQQQTTTTTTTNTTTTTSVAGAVMCHMTACYECECMYVCMRTTNTHVRM